MARNMDEIAYVSNGTYSLFLLTDEPHYSLSKLEPLLRQEGECISNMVDKDKEYVLEAMYEGRKKTYYIQMKEGSSCGTVSMFYPVSDIPEIGIELDRAMQNKGIAKEIVKLLVRKVEHEEALNRFRIRIFKENAHSIHVFEKMGAIRLAEEDYIDDSLKPFVYEYSLSTDAFDS